VSATLNETTPTAHMSLAVGNGTAVLTVRGEVDVANSGHLRALGEDAIGDAVRVIRIDLSEVSFIDSTGLAALVAIRNAAAGAGRRLVLDRPTARVRRVLQLTTLDAVFEVDPPAA
jgi:anti-anti-sigma factor